MHLPQNPDHFGQRPGLFALKPVPVVVLSGEEFGVCLPRKALAMAADAALRALQQGPGLFHPDTGWTLSINKKSRRKMGDNADLTTVDSQAIAGLEALVCHAVVAEIHADEAHRNPDVEAVLRLYAPVSVSSAEIENAPLGIFPSYSSAEALQTDQPTTGRTVSVRDLLRGAQRQDGTDFMG
jgi:Large polyvalent protein-associated domain 3